MFLRVLEYYEGVLFLTTNQVGVFDEAFKSRISMALYYPPLTVEQTVQIWRTQMRRICKNSPEIQFNNMDLEHYARELYQMQSANEQYRPVWNGRQIRNAFQTAVSMAEFHAQDKNRIEVTRSHFAKVAEVSNEFNVYLWRVKKSRNDQRIMLKKGLRDDTFVSDMAPFTVTAPALVPAYQMQPLSYQSSQIPVAQQMAPPNIVNPAYSQPVSGAVMSPGQYMSTIPGVVPGGQYPQYNIVQPQTAYTLANQQQPQYVSSNGYPSQLHGIQTQVQEGQQQMAQPSNQIP